MLVTLTSDRGGALRLRLPVEITLHIRVPAHTCPLAFGLHDFGHRSGGAATQKTASSVVIHVEHYRPSAQVPDTSIRVQRSTFAVDSLVAVVPLQRGRPLDCKVADDCRERRLIWRSLLCALHYSCIDARLA